MVDAPPDAKRCPSLLFSSGGGGFGTSEMAALHYGGGALSPVEVAPACVLEVAGGRSKGTHTQRACTRSGSLQSKPGDHGTHLQAANSS